MHEYGSLPALPDAGTTGKFELFRLAVIVKIQAIFKDCAQSIPGDLIALTARRLPFRDNFSL